MHTPVTYTSEEALTQHLLVETGSADGGVVLCGNNAHCVGSVASPVASGKAVTVIPLGGQMLVVCGENVSAGDLVFAASGGLVTATNTHGTTFRAIDSGASGDFIRAQYLGITPAP